MPNSQLIAEQVTNWTLLDNIGRLQLPVGVAYGSDATRVKQILLEMASAPQLVIQNHPFVSPPKVLFLGFGDSALNFERGSTDVPDLQTPLPGRTSTRPASGFPLPVSLEGRVLDLAFPCDVWHVDCLIWREKLCPGCGDGAG